MNHPVDELAARGYTNELKWNQADAAASIIEIARAHEAGQRHERARWLKAVVTKTLRPDSAERFANELNGEYHADYRSTRAAAESAALAYIEAANKPKPPLTVGDVISARLCPGKLGCQCTVCVSVRSLLDELGSAAKLPAPEEET